MTPIVKGDYTFILPSYFNLVDLQKVILLDVLAKHSRGQFKQSEEMLEVSWRLNQSLRNDFYLIGQLVVLIMGRYSTGVSRKLEYLPIDWHQRLSEHDYRTSFSNSLEAEVLGTFNYIKNLHLSSSIEVWGEQGWLLNSLLNLPFLQPYYHLSAIDSYNVQKQMLAETKRNNICLSDQTQIDQTIAWWNIPGQIFVPSWLNQPRKATHYMLDLELTQKILQVKELAAKTGKWPQSVPNMESEICPGVEWVYQVSPDGTTMSIYLSEQPEWLTERIGNNPALPLTYSTRRIPDYDQSLN